ncbi:MAG: GNAT family N-acetyltransferase [Mogibacterium sp.]|nr:GNAT family N-acetyltransferase [Mogibacterium sp.]
MIIKNTPWEKRNLGIASSVELIIEQHDNWSAVEKDISDRKEQYQVMHVPGGLTDVLINAQDLGFRMIETNIQLVRDLKKIELPQIYKRFEPHISYHIADSEETDYILSRISEGNMFTTDKVAKDPLLGSKKSGERYAFWTKDVLSGGAELLCMFYKDKMIGFDVLVKKNDTTANAFLGGLFPEYNDSGLGFSIIYQITAYARDCGYKKIVTGVSSNNFPILKLHELLGYSTTGCTYCLIKHA